MKICVTQADIESGKPLTITKCAVACALRRCVKSFVWLNNYVVCTGKDKYVNLPERASNFTRNFDDGKPVKPFTFDLKLK